MACTQTVPMQLPFAPKRGWKVAQGNNGTISHVGSAAFCWNFAIPQGNSKGVHGYASAASEVVDVHAAKRWFYVKYAEGEFCAYVHWLPNSLKVKVGNWVQPELRRSKSRRIHSVSWRERSRSPRAGVRSSCAPCLRRPYSAFQVSLPNVFTCVEVG